MRNKSGLYATHDVWLRTYGEKSNWFFKASIARPKKKKWNSLGEAGKPNTARAEGKILVN